MNDIALIIIIVELAILIPVLMMIYVLINIFRNWLTKTLEERIKNKYNAIINDLEQKHTAAKSAYEDYRGAYENLQKKGFEIDTKIDGLINSIDSFEKESKDNKENLSVLMEKEKLIRIINPSEVFKLTNDTDCHVLIKASKLINTKIQK